MHSIFGKVSVEQSKIYVNVDSGVFDFYKHLAYKEFPNLKYALAGPRHGHHVTVARKPLHEFDYQKALEFKDEEVKMTISPEDIYIGGLNKGFVGFYIYVNSPRLEEIRDILGVRGSNDSLHITMFSTKSESKKWKNK